MAIKSRIEVSMAETQVKDRETTKETVVAGEPRSAKRHGSAEINAGRTRLFWD